ncbi:unnamed protein product [Phytophthora fragariaefolia]|uniref:Unnamed protein product n=1 Tax=Phytophthora fragariaefolia TaxID=1490495 RepID=A0A9W7D3D1_9STRA|nr:unnamed protein product [Phytophthora fragariaefolia]
MERTASSDALALLGGSSSSTASSSSGESGAPAARPKAGLVASYLLRSAMDWRRGGVDTVEQEPATRRKERAVAESDSGDKEQVKLEDGGTLEVEAEPDAVATDGREAAEEMELKEKQVEETEQKQFEVTYQCLPDIETTTESEGDAGSELARRPMQYLDVLLQTDELGVGLNVGLSRLGGEDSGSVLVVQSFRRVNERDVGPAEACGKIRVGDILHAVDGDEVCSLQQLHAKLRGRLGKRRKFMLLRFLRPLLPEGDPELPTTSVVDQKRRPVDVDKMSWSEIDSLVRNNPQLAMLVRQLATTNELLQEQLVASKLKQEEQNIQLEQLHALYARTQAEGLPLFSISKSIRPFSRKSSSSRLGNASEKPIPTKIQTEVTEAINAEYSRLRQEFQLQHLLDKRELEKKFAEKALKLEQAAAKKVEMLEAGFQRALELLARDHHCSCHNQEATTTDFSGLSDEKSHQKCDQTTDGGENQNSDKFVEPLEQNGTPALWQIQRLLAEYDNIRCMRTTRLVPTSVDCPSAKV